MSDATPREEKRRLRGLILRSLAVVYGKAVGGGSDYVTLRTLASVAGTTSATVQAELTFLVELEYVRQAQAKDALDTFAPACWRITAKGMRVVNGEASDASIEVE